MLSNTSPFEIPLIIERIFSFLDQKSLNSCLSVCRHWNAHAVTLYWADIIKNDWDVTGDKVPWDSFLNNLCHISNLVWLLPRASIDRTAKITQVSDALQTYRRQETNQLHRLKYLALRGIQNDIREVEILLASVPKLSQLSMDSFWLMPTKIPLDEIIGFIPQLKYLDLQGNLDPTVRGIKIGSNKDYVQTTIIPQLPSGPLYTQPSISQYKGWSSKYLLYINLSYTAMTAQDIINLSFMLPSLLVLKFEISALLRTLKNYQTPELIAAEYNNDNDDNFLEPRAANPIQQLAKDFSRAWKNLYGLGIRNVAPSHAHAYAYAQSQANNEPYTLLLNIVDSMGPKLKSLHIMTRYLTNELLETLLVKAPKFERLLWSGWSWSSAPPELSSNSLVQFIQTCPNLKALRVQGFDIDLDSFKHQQSEDNVDDEDWETHSMLPLIAPIESWACFSHLEYLELRLSEDPYWRILISVSIPIQRNFFDQLSKLTKLRYLALYGKIAFPLRLEQIGFYKLAALRQLKALSISFFFPGNQTNLRDPDTSTSDGDDVTLRRVDLEWMINNWPNIKLLQIGLEPFTDEGFTTMQRWVDEIDGGRSAIKIEKQGYFRQGNDTFQEICFCESELVDSGPNGNGNGLQCPAHDEDVA
ncbi:hypothetical protein BGZ76_006784 [Entomortierella beljakovae]|nr:hypothetical protein BGZ76_006784 [Entomortierella beljakovae]